VFGFSQFYVLDGVCWFLVVVLFVFVAHCGFVFQKKKKKKREKKTARNLKRNFFFWESVFPSRNSPERKMIEKFRPGRPQRFFVPALWKSGEMKVLQVWECEAPSISQRCVSATTGGRLVFEGWHEAVAWRQEGQGWWRQRWQGYERGE
jgi:hypothetical protein